MKLTALRLAVVLLVLLPVRSSIAAEARNDKSEVMRWPEKSDGKGQVFDGTQFVALSARPDVGTGPYSIAVWVKANDLGGGDATYGRGIARSTRKDQIGDWLLSVHPDGRVRFCNWRKPGADLDGSHVTTEVLVEPDVWCLIVAAWDGKASHIFVNGVEAKYTNTTTASGWETGHEVGRSWTQPGYHWAGLISDLRIRTRVPDAADILADFQRDPRSRVEQVVIKPAGDPRVSAAIDREIDARLKRNNVATAPPADDAEFQRRATLDLAGRIPTGAETDAFLADASPDKRLRLIESLLAGREMPFYWAQVLSNGLMPPESRRDPKFLGYLRNGLANNKSWDRFVREMVVARPSGPDDQYAGVFLTARREALKDNTMARDLGRALFGVNLRCAQCHDHPQVPEWSQRRFLGLSAFFTRSYEYTYKNPASQPVAVLAERNAGELEYVTASGKKVVPLLFLDGKAIVEPVAAKDEPPPKDAPPPVPAFSRREALVRAALEPKSPYLKKAIVNRVWKQLMGRGLVEPVDMMHEGNPATHPELLDLLADDFVEHGYDLRRLIAVIMQSQVYARSSRRPGGKDLPEEGLYALAILKPLDADQLATSLPLATGYYDERPKRATAPIRADAWPDLVAQFDSPTEEFEPTAAQALFLLNSDYVHKHFVTDSKLVKTLSAAPTDAEVARLAYRAILSRLPSAAESTRVSRYLSERGASTRAQACQELVWAMFSGPEFRFNH